METKLFIDSLFLKNGLSITLTTTRFNVYKLVFLLELFNDDFTKGGSWTSFFQKFYFKVYKRKETELISKNYFSQ